MRTHRVVPFTIGQRADFLIQCEGCSLPARWLDRFVPDEVRKRVRDVRPLFVEGYKTPSRNLKYFPAKSGIKIIAEDYDGPLLAPGSGNFAESSKVILDEERRTNELIAIVPSHQPAGKRQRLERRGISIMNELDLQRELGLRKPEPTFRMLKQYAERMGYRILDQYDCDWNSDSYLPIAEQIIRQTGGVSLFAGTAGTKGKFRIGAELKRKRAATHLVVVYPPPGQAFPGGRNKQQGLEVANQFDIEPTAEFYVDELVAYEQMGLMYPYIETGVTGAAELSAAWKYILAMHEAGRIDELRIDGGPIIPLVVCSDSIFPYVDEGMKHFPHLFGEVVEPSA